MNSTTNAPGAGKQRHARVRLRKELSRAVENGQPWIFRDALQEGERPADGALTTVLARSGRPLAWGFYDGQSPIALRLLGLHPAPRDPADLVRQRLRTALLARLERLDLAQTNAFRWVHGEADRLPGIHIDVYDRHAVIRHDGAGARAFYEGLVQLPDHLLAVAGEFGERGFGIDQIVDREARGAGITLPAIEIRENGLRFVVNVGQAQKGGLFLDQRDNRIEIARHAAGQRVLNLFGYTGGFSVHCAAAGAAHTDTVDLAKPAIDAARENFRLNNLPVDQAGFFAEDAFAFLEKARSEGRSWDIVISDPPSFAPSKKAVAAGLRAYQRLHGLAMAVVRKGGLLCAASCSSHVPLAEFLKTLKAAAAEAKRGIEIQSTHGAAFDHPVVDFFPEGTYLKFVIARVIS